MSVVRIVVCAIVLAKCVMDAIRVREKCFMHRKERLVRFMTVLETVNVCKTVENVRSEERRVGKECRSVC